jgi:hypothetical protein
MPESGRCVVRPPAAKMGRATGHVRRGDGHGPHATGIIDPLAPIKLPPLQQPFKERRSSGGVPVWTGLGPRTDAKMWAPAS